MKDLSADLSENQSDGDLAAGEDFEDLGAEYDIPKTFESSRDVQRAILKLSNQEDKLVSEFKARIEELLDRKETEAANDVITEMTGKKTELQKKKSELLELKAKLRQEEREKLEKDQSKRVNKLEEEKRKLKLQEREDKRKPQGKSVSRGETSDNCDGKDCQKVIFSRVLCLIFIINLCEFFFVLLNMKNTLNCNANCLVFNHISLFSQLEFAKNDKD